MDSAEKDNEAISEEEGTGEEPSTGKIVPASSKRKRRKRRLAEETSGTGEEPSTGEIVPASSNTSEGKLVEETSGNATGEKAKRPKTQCNRVTRSKVRDSRIAGTGEVPSAGEIVPASSSTSKKKPVKETSGTGEEPSSGEILPASSNTSKGKLVEEISGNATGDKAERPKTQSDMVLRRSKVSDSRIYGTGDEPSTDEIVSASSNTPEGKLVKETPLKMRGEARLENFANDGGTIIHNIYNAPTFQYPYFGSAYEQLFVREEKPIKEGKRVYQAHFRREESDYTPPSIQLIAIKEMGKNDYLTQEQQAREPSHMMELQYHPNVVTYIHSDECGKNRENYFYIAMELCHHDTLQDRVEKHEVQYPEMKDDEYCKSVILHIARGLQHIHENRIIHRDLKPPNILFSRDSSTVKVGDFGFSKKLRSGENATSQSSNTKGTDGWRSTETYKEGNDLKTLQESDVFSFGLVTHYTLSRGEHAFGPDDAKWSSNIKSYEGLWLGGIKGADASIARDLVGKMLQNDPAKRPTIQEVMAHPYFWPLKTKVHFLGRVVDRYNEEYKAFLKNQEKQPPMEVDMKPAVFSRMSQGHDMFFHKVESDRTSNKLEKILCASEPETSIHSFITSCAEVFLAHNHKVNLEANNQHTTAEDGEVSGTEWISRICNMFTLRFRSLNADEERPRVLKQKTKLSMSLIKLNSLKLKRKYHGSNEWIKWFNKCAQIYGKMSGIKDARIKLEDIPKLQEGDDIFKWFKECLKIASATITSPEFTEIDEAHEHMPRGLIYKERKGEEKSWKYCLAYEGKLRSHEHGDDKHHEPFVENCQNCQTETIFELLRYVRKAFMHFEEKRHSEEKNKTHGEKWFQTEGDLWEFVSAAIPEFFPHVYNTMKDEFPDFIEKVKQLDHRLPDISRLRQGKSD